MSFESAISTWLHATYSDADAVYSAVKTVMTDPVMIDKTAYDLRTVVDSSWNLAYDLTPLGFLASLWHGVSTSSAPVFAGSWPQANQYLISGGYMAGTTLVIPNCYRASIQATVSGRPFVNVLGLLGSSPGQAAAAAAALKTAWEASGCVAKGSPSAYTMTGYSVMDLSTTTGAVALLTSTTTGGRPGTIADRGACTLVKFSGGTRSRTSNGRMYIGPLLVGDIGGDGVTVTAAQVTAVGNQISQLSSAMATAGFPLCVISRKTASAHVISSWQVQSIIATQRRRIRGG